jgi:hypothetical protein
VVSFTCAVEDCKDFVNIEIQETKIFPFIVDKINKKLLAELQTRFTLDGHKIDVKWPRIKDPRTNDKGHIVLEVTDWGVEKVTFSSGLSIKVPLLDGSSVALPCPIKGDPIDGGCDKNACPPPPPPPVDDKCYCGEVAGVNIEFASNDDDVNERYGDNRKEIAMLRRCLADIERPCRLTLTGNTDCEGKLPGNQDLAWRRAKGVKRWLEQKNLGGAFTRITVPAKDDQPGWQNPIHERCYSAVKKEAIPMNRNCNEYNADGSFRHLCNASGSCMRGNRRVDFKTEK